MTAIPASARPRWEIFCQVVDNFGDIGVCWRLARDLARRGTAGVRLWVDDWDVLVRICPAAAVADPGQGACVDGVELCHWTTAFVPRIPGEIVVEAFACELPPAQLEAMAALRPAPAWINLEYLSAEDWVAGCHGLASPHPRLPLVKHFFFPGFDVATGGLLREAELIARRDRFLGEPGGRGAWLAERDVSAAPEVLRVSLFAYAQPDLGGLFEAWQRMSRPVVVLVPESRIVGDVAAALGAPALAAGARIDRGTLSVRVLPFTDQDGYDALLWACDLNFVRGEDSFVRAQWAARPFIWQIYPQAEAAHHDKLEAFLAHYLPGLPPAAAAAHARFWRAWNGCAADTATPAEAWPAFADALPALAAHAQAWCARQAAQPDLASRLTKFCSHLAGGPG
ncbi:MAG: elongation factor P maturation arginine rhamnosyltransferase EarP [Thauera sp.]